MKHIKEMFNVCIIVPIYNGEEFLRDCLDSLLVQTYSNWKCILVNDGSTDNSQNIIDAYCSKDNRFTCLVKNNEKSASLARRYALERVDAEWIVCIDADDAVAPNFIEMLVKRQIETNADVVIWKSVRYEDGFRGGKMLWQIPALHFDMGQVVSGREACLLTLGEWQIGGSGMLRRDLLLKVPSGPYMNSDEYEQRVRFLMIDKCAFADVTYFWRANIGISDSISIRMFDRTMVDIQLEELVYCHFPERKDKIKALLWQRLFNLIYLCADFELNKSIFTQDELKRIDAMLYHSYKRMYKTKTIATYPLHGVSLLFGYNIFRKISTLYVKYKRSNGGMFHYQ